MESFHVSRTHPKKISSIFIGLTEIAGHYQKVSDGLRQLGYDVVFVGGSAHPFQYSSVADQGVPVYALPALYERLNKFRRDRKPSALRGIALDCATAFVKVLLFFWSLYKFDAFIFGAGQSFSRTGFDLWILRLSGKTIIANIGHGSEARPAYLNGAIRYQDGRWPPLEKLRKKAKRTLKKIRRIEKHAHVIISSPFTSQFLRRSAVDYFYLGTPTHLNVNEVKIERPDNRVKILHAPSNRISKGSNVIQNIISEIQLTHNHVDFIAVSGVPNSEVLNIIAQCDLVVDQLYSDSSFTGIALEASSLGLPVVIGGHGFHKEYFMTKFMREYPSIICDPSEVKAELVELITKPDKRSAIGEQARSFVFEKLSEIEVARRYEKIMLGTLEPEAYFDPRDCNYCLGVALSLQDLKDILTRYVHRFGLKGLYLEDRIDLQNWIETFISEPQP